MAKVPGDLDLISGGLHLRIPPLLRIPPSLWASQKLGGILSRASPGAPTRQRRAGTVQRGREEGPAERPNAARQQADLRHTAANCSNFLRACGAAGYPLGVSTPCPFSDTNGVAGQRQAAAV